MQKSKRVLVLAAAAVAGLSGIAHAASGTWSGSTDTTWITSGNWTAVPGSTTVTTNADTATFNTNPTNAVPVIDLNRNLKSITFDTANVGALTLGTTGGNALLLTSAGTISTTTTVANPINVNAPLNLYGNYTFTSSAPLAANVLNLGGAITPATASAVLLTLSGTNTGDNTVSGLITNGTSSALSLTKSSTAQGKWILSNTANSFTGAVSINSGVLSVSSIGSTGGSNSCLGQNGTINIGSGTTTAGTLMYTGGGETSNKTINFAATTTGGAIIDQSGSGLLTLSGNTTNAGTTKTITLQGSLTGNGLFSGNIVGASGTKLLKNGSNTWTVSGANTYSGGTTISAGTLIGASHDAFGAATGQVNMQNGTTLGLASEPGVGIAPYNIGFLNNGYTVGLTVGRTTANTDDSSIVDTLGTLKFSNNTVINITPGANLSSGAPTLNVAVSLDGSSSGGTVNAAPGVKVNLSSVTNTTTGARGLVLGGTSTDGTVGAITNGSTGGTVSLTKSDAGTWTLNSASNNYTGLTTVSAGTLASGVNGALVGALTVAAGGTLSVGTTNNTVGTVTVADTGAITGTGTLTSGSSFNLKSGTFDVVFDGSAALNFTGITGGGGTATLNAANTYTGLTSVNCGNNVAGELRYGIDNAIGNGDVTLLANLSVLNLGTHNDTVGTVTLTNGSITGSGTLTSTGTYALAQGLISVNLAGVGITLNKTSGYNVTLSGNNSFTGPVSIAGGRLIVSNIGNAGANSNLGTTGTINIGSTTSQGQLQYAGTGETTDKVIDLAGTTGGVGIAHYGSGLLKFTSSLTASGLGDKNLTLWGTTAQTGEIAGIIPDSTGFKTSVIKTGDITTWVLSASNTYTGLTTVNGGTLVMGHATNTIADSAPVTVSGATAVLSVPNTDTVGAVTLASGAISGAGTLTGSSYSLTDTGTISANLAGSGVTLSKTGAGTAIISGNTSYTGLTTVNAGTLEFTGSKTLAGGLSINDTAKAKITASAGASALTVSSLTTTGSGKLDVTDNAMVVPAGNITTVAGQVGTGFNLNGGGLWDGPGITSSTAGATANMAVGAIKNNDGFGNKFFDDGTSLTKFHGQTVVLNDVLAAYTYFGDSELNGTVDFDDYARIDGAFQTGGGVENGFAPAVADNPWLNGDFDYNGSIDFDDYARIDASFQFLNPLGAPVMALQQVTVPEPTTLGLLAVSGLGLLARRRRSLQTHQS